MPPDLFWIPGPWRGRLAVVTRPRGGDWLEDEIDGWRRAGLDAVLSLLEPGEAADLGLAKEAEVARSRGIRPLAFPIPDRGIPAHRSEALSLIADLSAALDHGETVAVHCRQGIGRSGLIAAALLVASGIPASQAIAAVTAARGLTIPETPEQLNWIRQLPALSVTP